jgi:uncharacterized protein (TIGR00661 family)
VKIFYGVQGTGNGHITRARALAPKLKASGADVTYLFTGRPRSDLFEMDVFGDFEWRRGLTFQTHKGNIQYVATALNNNLLTFLRDVSSLRLEDYDLVISDFEPVTAWAARMRGIRTVGIGHQYAFGQAIPIAGADFMGTQLLKYFAPVTVGLGVHWHHFGESILPPIIETTGSDCASITKKIIVYLPFEDVHEVIRLLEPFNSHQFHIYNPSGDVVTGGNTSHITVKGVARQSFKNDFADCGGVICNAGFELPSEALHHGKRLLVKPLHGQMEQLSNALAIDQLNLGHVMHDLNAESIARWLVNSHSIGIRFPDVAQSIVDWLLRGDLSVDRAWVDAIWAQCQPIAGSG